MSTPFLEADQPLRPLVLHLFSRREAILNNWRTVCEADVDLKSVSMLSREEFNNLLPVILKNLEQRLLDYPPQESPTQLAHGHGLHRWQKAHDLVDLIRELNHLTATLYQELQLFQRLTPQTDPALILAAYLQISQVMAQTVEGSLSKYDDLQRLAAALEQALTQTQELTQQRGDLLRSSSHGLRGSFGIVRGAVSLLSQESLSDEERTRFLDMLNRNLSNIQAMLEVLLDFSRLEAGEEPLQVQAVDASELLRELVGSAQPLASQQGLALQADGPAMLPVETDGIKLRRIVQNLLLNALKYTPSGIVSVSWSRENDYRWNVSVQDSGPGLPAHLLTLFARQLRPTVEPTAVLDASVEEVDPRAESIPKGQQLAQLASRSGGGEGIGLQVVKQLCDLLKASLEVETRAGRGTLFRIRLPVHLSKP